MSGFFKNQILLFSVAGVILLVVGFFSGMTMESPEKERFQKLQETALRSQNGFLAETLKSHIDRLKIHAQTIQKLRQNFQTDKQAASTVPGGKLLHWIELEADDKQIVQIRQSTANPRWLKSSLNTPLLDFEQNYFRQIKNSLDVFAVNQKKSSVLRVPRSGSNRDWLAFAFLSAHKPQDLKKNNHTIVVALVDPIELFPSFKNFKELSDGGSRRGFLLSNNGRVLLHSQENMTGANLSNTDFFLSTVRDVFSGSKSKGFSAGTTEDELPYLADFVKLGSLPIGVVMEQTLPKSQGHFSFFKGDVIALFGPLLLIFGTILIGLLLLSRNKLFTQTSFLEPSEETEYYDHDNDDEIAYQDKSPVLAGPDTSTNRATPNFSNEFNSSSIDQLHKVKKAISYSKSESRELFSPTPGQVFTVNGQKLTIPPSESFKPRQARSFGFKPKSRPAFQAAEAVDQFEEEASLMATPSRLTAMLAKTASQVCDSPILYFSFHETIQTAVLESDAGFLAGEEPATLSFKIDIRARQEISRLTKNGGIASLSDYSPLSKILLEHLGVAHFEAWTVSTDNNSRIPTTPPRLLGILVIVKAGLQSSLNRKSLVRLMRTTSLIYGNTVNSI